MCTHWGNFSCKRMSGECILKKWCVVALLQVYSAQLLTLNMSPLHCTFKCCILISMLLHLAVCRVLLFSLVSNSLSLFSISTRLPQASDNMHVSPHFWIGANDRTKKLYNPPVLALRNNDALLLFLRTQASKQRVSGEKTKKWRNMRSAAPSGEFTPQ